MGRSIVIAAALVSSSVVYSVHLWRDAAAARSTAVPASATTPAPTSRDRYVLVGAGNGGAYCLDQKTGKLFVLAGHLSVPVEIESEDMDEELPTEPKQRAEELARKAKTLWHNSSNMQQINFLMRRASGIVRVKGWSAHQLDPQNFVVRFTYTLNDRPHSWAFLVNTALGGVIDLCSAPESHPAKEHLIASDIEENSRYAAQEK